MVLRSDHSSRAGKSPGRSLVDSEGGGKPLGVLSRSYSVLEKAQGCMWDQTVGARRELEDQETAVWVQVGGQGLKFFIVKCGKGLLQPSRSGSVG